MSLPLLIAASNKLIPFTLMSTNGRDSLLCWSGRWPGRRNIDLICVALTLSVWNDIDNWVKHPLAFHNELLASCSNVYGDVKYIQIPEPQVYTLLS